MRGAALKWRELGAQLLNPSPENELNIIENNHRNNVVRCCQCVLEKWLDTTTDAKWDQLIEALRSDAVQLNNLANQLEQKLNANN